MIPIQRCSGCRTAKDMFLGSAICGNFHWKLWYCPTCSDVRWTSIWQKLGYRLTKFMSQGEIMISEAVDASQED